MKQARWDIFCKIVDNYGDIGVCWRLAKQLANEYPHLNVRLYIDDIAVAAKIIQRLDISELSAQTIDNVEIYRLDSAQYTPDLAVIIETFGCGLPANYVHAMESNLPAQAVWINLEYLSAESWVGDFHGKPSKQSCANNPALTFTKHYFFPGFSDNTGGLLREKSVAQDMRKFSAPLAQTDSEKSLSQLLQSVIPASFSSKVIDLNALNVSLFCYPQADVNSCITAYQNHHQAVNIFIPFNDKLTAFKSLFADFNYEIGEIYAFENITLIVLPFLSQPDYDALLQNCDLNFVRGEDSWIRAIWAAKPFIWQPYIQTEHTHIQKLNAFLQTHFRNAPQPLQSIIVNAHLAWSNGLAKNDDNAQAIWLALLSALPKLQAEYAAQAQQLIQQTDLAAALVVFSEHLQPLVKK